MSTAAQLAQQTSTVKDPVAAGTHGALADSSANMTAARPSRPAPVVVATSDTTSLVQTPSALPSGLPAMATVSSDTPAIEPSRQAVAAVVHAPDATSLVEAPAPLPTAPPAAVAVSSEPAAHAAANEVATTADIGMGKDALAANTVADRRLKHATEASVDAEVKEKTGSSDTGDETDTQESATVSTAPARVSPLAFTPLSAVSSPVSVSSSLDTSIGVSGSISAAVPVFPAPGPLPTGLIVGNGGVIGTATQLLGPTTNSLFPTGGGSYVSNGSLQVNNANFSQGYSIVSVLGVPLLTLNPVGTVLTSTTGAVVGGTGLNSHLTLIGGVTSDNYIDDINNGSGSSGLLGIVLPKNAPAFASSCLNAIVVQVACYGINAAQDYQVLVGDGATANGSKEVVIGTNASHTLPLVDANTAFPGDGRNDPNNPSGVPTADYEARLGHSVVIGDDASGTANAQTILGAEATANAANSVALGYQSIANRGAQTNYVGYGLVAPQNSAGEVSIGSPGQERQITNVAAGSAPTDAANVAQLAGVSAEAGNSLQYDNTGRTSVTLGGTPSTDGGVTGGTTITNVHQAALNAGSTDAVNGAQLYATNNSVSNIVNTTSKFFQANSAGTGSAAVGADSVAAGPGAVSGGGASIAIGSGAVTSAAGNNAIAIGTGADATFANSVALGNGSVTTVGAQSNYTAYGLTPPQTSAGEVNIGNRQLTGVAAGSAGTDAVNVNQLASVGDQVSTLNKLAVQYDADAAGNPVNQITLAGNGSGAPVTVSNVAAGNLSATSTDAVNGAQLNATNNTVSTIVNSTSKFFQANSAGTGSNAAGTDSIAAGPGAISGADASIALGSGAVTGAGSDNAIAIGTGANATFANSIALGSGSATTVGAQTNYAAYGLAAPQTSAGELNIGNRQLTGVAAGQADTDAVNVEQLKGVSASAANSVQYDAAPNKTSVTLAGPVSSDGGVSGGTRVTNVHQGDLSATSTDAVNGAQLNATNDNVSNIVNTTSKYFQANSTGTGSDAAGTDAIAAGPQSVAAGNASIALGSGAVTSAGSDNAIAIGTGANADFANSIALGNGSATTVGAQSNYQAYGLAAPQTSAGELNIGNRQLTGLAAGTADSDAVNVEQLKGVAGTAANSVQYDSAQKSSITLAGTASTDGGVTGGTKISNVQQGSLSTTSTDAVNGAQLNATNDSVSNIVNTTSKYFQANSTGTGSDAVGTDAIAAGPQSVAAGNASIALGSGAVTGDDNAIAIGTGANAANANSIALGNGSATTVGAQTGYQAYGLAAPQSSAGELNIGNRKITGVAAGELDTDAVNVEQLKGVSADAANSVQYDAAPNRTSITLAGPTSSDGGATNGTTLTNLHQGSLAAFSTDAVNGSQLWHAVEDTTNQYSNYSLYNDLNGPDGVVTARKYFHVNSDEDGSVADGDDSISVGPQASAASQSSIAVGNNSTSQGDYSVAVGDSTMASAVDSVAVGTNANASFANSVALGAGSVTAVGARANYIAYGLAAPQTSAGEVNIGNRQLTGVAAGSAPDDAVNVAQLEAVSQAGGGTGSKLAVQYTPDASGNPTNAIALSGDGTGKPVSITNVAAGAETAASTDAANGSQIWHWSQDASNIYSNYSLYNEINSINQSGGGNSKYVQVNSTLGAAAAGGANSVAIGPVASAGGANSVAVGNGASAAADNSVALGSGSVANRDNSVSVGSPGAERQITNVAAGTSDTDAANVGQVNSGVQQAENWAKSYTDQSVGALSNKIDRIGNRADAGVAAAMAAAGLPQAYEPGKSMAAVAAGTFRNESSIAVGVSTISEGGRWVYKMTGSVDTRGDGGVSIGAGMQW